MASRLDREILLKTLKGYAEVNAITEAEHRARLAKMTSAESWAIFAALYETWERLGQQAGGDWEALAHRRLEEAVALRKAFERLARHKGLI
jgi:hypothetical protein